MRTRISPVLFVALALGFPSALESSQKRLVSREELLAGAPLGMAPDQTELVDDRQVLAVSAEMKEFLDSHVIRNASGYVKLHQLLYSIISQKSFGLEYDETTRTASETFRLRRGNCLSFSNMFVALARDLDLDAEFQEVEIPPDWTYRDDAFILNRHVNVSVDLGTAGHHAVDFNLEEFSSTYDRRTISDDRALAHYYNNMGVERMQAGDTAAALGYFQKALAEKDHRFSPAWTNLGILYQRHRQTAHAEAAFLEAVRVDRGNVVALSNLVNLYERQGDVEQTADYRNRVERHRLKNPYFRYHRARDAFLAGDYDTAISHLKYAIRKRKHEDRFCFLLGLCYLQKGDEEAARRWMDRAEEIASSDSVKQNYANKIERLLSTSE
jgi:Flp pilus assembly protein TadD